MITAAKPPPSISGGTLLVMADGKTAVAADPDRDRVSLVDLASKSLLADIALDPSDEPGRVAEGPPGQANVALRMGGAVVTIDIASRQIVRRTSVCPAPRGLAYDKTSDALHVACAGGELVTLAATTGKEVRRLRLQSDLRDVVVQGNTLLVSLFRKAQVLVIDNATGGVVDQRALEMDPFFAFSPSVAWRMLPFGGGVALVHQRGAEFVSTEPGGYGGQMGCEHGIVHSAVSFFDEVPLSFAPASPSIASSALPVDLAFSPDGSRFAIIAAGSDAVFETTVSSYRFAEQKFDDCSQTAATKMEEGQPIAVAFAGNQRVIQTREPAQLVLADGAVIDLGGESVFDTGHMLFHGAPTENLSMACASCHPEGRDDARVWMFSDVGARRTQSVVGGVLATAPLHWSGDMEGFDTLMNEVFSQRMGGPPQSPERLLAAALWLDSLPLLPASPPVDATAVERGKQVFNDPTVGCTTCHSGPRLTNNASADVGTGGVFQVPSLLGISARAPFMHDGCAPTMHDRFGGYCGGGDLHGVTSGLSMSQIDDLVSYLNTL